MIFPECFRRPHVDRGPLIAHPCHRRTVWDLIHDTEEKIIYIGYKG